VAAEESSAHEHLAEAELFKSFLVLFFKKEQKESTSFLKKRSKKLLFLGRWFRL
jgi:hypothetical protein